MQIAAVDTDASDEVAKLAVCLINEIMERTGLQHFDVDFAKAKKLCKRYIEHGQYHVIAAHDNNQIVGFGALCESHSIYAEGAFGIIQEFYVMPEYRSQKIGEHLIQAMVGFAAEREWTRLELCTPPVPEFDRTVAFYQSNGFEITGGYKMKRTIKM